MSFTQDQWTAPRTDVRGVFVSIDELIAAIDWNLASNNRAPPSNGASPMAV